MTSGIAQEDSRLSSLVVDDDDDDDAEERLNILVVVFDIILCSLRYEEGQDDEVGRDVRTARNLSRGRAMSICFLDMATTTPSEFMAFAKDMGLERLPPITDPSPSSNLTGLAVLNNICHLIEHLHALKVENNRLRAHLDLVNDVDRFLSRTGESEGKPLLHSTLSIPGDEKFPRRSWKVRKFSSNSFSISSKDRAGRSLVISIRWNSSSGLDHHDESTSFLPTDDLSPGQSNWHNWSKVRHALHFSLRRKKSPDSLSVSHGERSIPAISISVESDEEKHAKTKKSTNNANLSPVSDYHRRVFHGEDTDRDDESIRSDDKRGIYAQHDSTYLSASATLINDEDASFARKQSKIGREVRFNSLLRLSRKAKHRSVLRLSLIEFALAPVSIHHEQINFHPPATFLLHSTDVSTGPAFLDLLAHYRHKLRSKLDTVKKQFSEQIPSPRFHGSTFEEIGRVLRCSSVLKHSPLGSGLNHALLSAKLAPAMTKSYQQKMRDWQRLQKSDFLVNYRRQSISPEIRRASLASVHLSAPLDLPVLLSPILSPQQRSLIVHQWREIMAEELVLRRKQDFLQERLLHLKQLENNLKELKTRIFSSNGEESFLRHRSLSSSERDAPRRSRSLQTVVSMPASWTLAVQSAAYSDVLDGTSLKSSERALLFHQHFFQQLKHLRDDREQFEESLSSDLRRSSPCA